MLVLSKVGRSETQLAHAVETIQESGFDLLAEHWPLRDGFQADLDAGRAGRESRNPYLREAAERMEDGPLQAGGRSDVAKLRRPALTPTPLPQERARGLFLLPRLREKVARSAG